MKKTSLILFVSVAFFSSLLISCGDDDSTMYDLRPLSQKIEAFTSTTENRVPMSYKRPLRHGFISSKENNIPEVRGVSKQVSTPQTTTYTYEYGDNAHLFWTKATLKDELGDTIYIVNQTLDNDGFPTRSLWYDAEGNFGDAEGYSYDKSLYLRTSYIHYAEDPTHKPDARRDSEFSNEWNKYGILITWTSIDYYYLNGTKSSIEWKLRSVMQKNVLRGSEGGYGYTEYYKEYDDGQLTYQLKTEFDSDGYPQSLSEDSNGDGTYVQIYRYETTKTVEGYLESVVWIEDGTNKKKLKDTFTYDEEGLLKKWVWYDASGDEFVLDAIYTVMWYRNPVNGPTGGEFTDFEIDEDGNPVGEYTTIDWTEKQKIYHYYSSLGEENYRRTFELEKVELPS